MSPRPSRNSAKALWYESQAAGLGGEFLREIESAVAAIQATPGAWPVFVQDTRRYLVHRFPYGVIYHWRQDAIVVVAIMHLRRKPGYWAERLKDER